MSRSFHLGDILSVSRFATAAVQRQHARLQLDYDRQAEKLLKALRERDAAVERNHGHIRAAYQTAESITALVDAYNKLEQALETACGERDQAKAGLLEAGSQGCPTVFDFDQQVEQQQLLDHEQLLARARAEHEDLERELRRLRQHCDRCEQYQAVVADDKAKRSADV